MAEDLYRKPLGKNESFRMDREVMGEIREGDLVESANRTVTSVNEAERERILQSLDKQSISAKSALESIRVGMLINDEAFQLLASMFGPIFQVKREKSRVMRIDPYTVGATVWIGPPELTVEDVAAFKHPPQYGEPRSERYARCRLVDMSDLRKVLDS